MPDTTSMLTNNATHGHKTELQNTVCEMMFRVSYPDLPERLDTVVTSDAMVTLTSVDNAYKQIILASISSYNLRKGTQFVKWPWLVW
jgi:hypothetical protein